MSELSSALIPSLAPLTIHRGTKRAYRFALKESASGPAINLTGSAFSGQIRRSHDDPTLILDLGIAVEDASAGLIAFTVDDADFSAFPAGFSEGVYDILWSQPDGSRPKLMFGAVLIHRTATKPESP